MLRHALAAVLVTVAACRSSQAEPPRPDRELDAMRMHMDANYDLVRAIERLLIRGKLDDAKRFAAAIAIAPDPPAHGPWAARVLAVRDRAAALARTKTVEDAVREVARLGAACGDCHGEVTAVLTFEKTPPVPPDLPTVDARMLRHRWAADRLWEGVVGSSDVAWREGLTVLAATPLEVLADRGPLARRLRQLADSARRTTGRVANRAVAYGEILEVCAGCHTFASPHRGSP